MKPDISIKRTIFIASLVLFPLILPVGSTASEPPVESTTIEPMEGARAFSEVQEKGLEPIAAESAEDTLKACLGRIPLDASVGQRLLAEKSCQLVEVKRRETALTF